MVHRSITIFILMVLLPVLSLNAISIYSFTLKTVSENAEISFIQIMMILAGLVLLIFVADRLKRNIQLDKLNIILLLAIISLTLATRTFWLLIFATEPVSDYYTYNDLATLLYQGYNFKGIYELSADRLNYASSFPHVSFFILTLSALYRLTGSAAYSIGQYFNILMTVYTAVMLYLLGKKYIDLWFGFFASVLFILFPSYLMFSTLLGTEPLFLAFIITALYFINLPLEKVKIKNIFTIGGFLALANSVRPVAVIFLIAIVLYALYFITISFSKENANKYLKYSALLILSFFAFSNVIYYSMTLLVHFPIAKSASGYSLYVGSNMESRGQWNENDMVKFMDQLNLNINNPQSAHESLQKDAIARYSQIIKDKKLLPFLYYKLEGFNDERYGVFWSFYSLKGNTVPSVNNHKRLLYDLSVNYYFLIALLSIGGCIALWKNKRQFSILLGLSFVGLVLSFLLVEVQGRYHIVLMPIYVLFASYPLYKLFEVLDPKAVEPELHRCSPAKLLIG